MGYLVEYKCDRCKSTIYMETEKLLALDDMPETLHMDRKAGVGHFRCGMYRFSTFWMKLNATVTVGAI